MDASPDHSVLIYSHAGSLMITFAEPPAEAQVPAPPPTRQDNVHEMFHGVDLVDPYHWLEDGSSAETRKWLAAQDVYTHSFLDAQPSRPRIRKRLLEMFVHDWIGQPIEEGGYYFFYKKLAHDELASIYRRKKPAGADEVLLDAHAISPDKTTSLVLKKVSPGGTLLLYALRHGGEDEVELHIFDMEKRHDLADTLPRAKYGGVAWKKDKTGFYYSRIQPEGPRVYFHVLGTDPASDAMIFGEGYGPEMWIGPWVSEDGRYLLITVYTGWTKTELYFQNLEQKGPIKPLITGIPAYFISQFAGDSLIVLTNWEAPNWMILKIDLRDPSRDKWKQIVPASGGSIENFSLIGGKIFVNYLHNVTSRIAIFSLDGMALGLVNLPSSGSATISGRWDRDQGILVFSSFTTPYSIYRYSSASGKRDLWFRSPIQFDSSRYVMRQVWYSSKDGTRVPMFLVHRKGLKPDGRTPTLLYGYGGFNTSLTPDFSSTAAWWIEQGGIYAVANTRGGAEFGEAWHRAGMLDKKQNVFDDFIAAAEWLIHNKYTNPDKLAIQGGSNGGLLVGAVTMQRPELFRAVLCEYPDLDMVRWYKFTRNPLAALEYGSAADPEQFKFLYAYSPYEHVRPGTAYPAMLFISGDGDTRVPPEQARKMTARVQAASTSGRPVLLMYDTNSGHSGGRAFTKAIDDYAFELTFLAWQLGI